MVISGKTRFDLSSPHWLPSRLLPGLLLPLGFILLSLHLQAVEEALKPFEFSLPRMGTEFRIVLYAPSQLEASRAAMAAFERVEKLEDLLSAYRRHSELVRLSREAVAAPLKVSPELFEVLDQATRMSQLSGGAFDITVGPVVELWREARRTKRLPDSAALAKAREAVDYRNMVLDYEARTVRLLRSDMKLDLGGIAAGYAADQALSLLRARGMQSAMVDAGGDIALGAAPPGKAGWKIAVRDPGLPRDATPCTLVLYDVAIATSGDAYQFLEADGQRYSHIVNPSSGMGVKDSASTTVIARDGTTADALATALSAMSVAEGLKLAESLEGASAYLVRRSGRQLQRFFSGRFSQECGHIRSGGK